MYLWVGPLGGVCTLACAASVPGGAQGLEQHPCVVTYRQPCQSAQDCLAHFSLVAALNTGDLVPKFPRLWLDFCIEAGSDVLRKRMSQIPMLAAPA